MSRNVIGADRVRRKLTRLKKTVDEELAIVNERNGKDLIRIARILHPGDGSTRADIKGSVVTDAAGNPDGYLADFGALSKVTEGESGPRPFVNPARQWLRKRIKGRVRRGINKAVKRAFNG